MCNSKNHPPECTCGFGGIGHSGKRGPLSSTASQFIAQASDRFHKRYPEFKEKQRASACFINPNARCPVCNESVFFYANEHGSRVFFDELGPPWPKHACTDKSHFSSRFDKFQCDKAFVIRSDTAVSEIMQWQKDLGRDFESEFTTKYGASPWPLAQIVQRIKSGKQVFIFAKLLQRDDAKSIFFSRKALPKCCKKGFVIAVGRRKISFIDTATLIPVEVPIERYRGASRFLDAFAETVIAER